MLRDICSGTTACHLPVRQNKNNLVQYFMFEHKHMICINASAFKMGDTSLCSPISNRLKPQKKKIKNKNNPIQQSNPILHVHTQTHDLYKCQ